jgi:hypothetical protein
MPSTTCSTLWDLAVLIWQQLHYPRAYRFTVSTEFKSVKLEVKKNTKGKKSLPETYTVLRNNRTSYRTNSQSRWLEEESRLTFTIYFSRKYLNGGSSQSAQSLGNTCFQENLVYTNSDRRFTAPCFPSKGYLGDHLLSVLIKAHAPHVHNLHSLQMTPQRAIEAVAPLARLQDQVQQFELNLS